MKRLEPCAGKLARTVLRGGSNGNVAFLPDSDIVTTAISVARLCAASLEADIRQNGGLQFLGFRQHPLHCRRVAVVDFDAVMTENSRLLAVIDLWQEPLMRPHH